MSYKPDEQDWMAYLYGELDDVGRKRFEQYILEDPQASLELETYRHLRKLLAQAEDKEVIAPPVFIGDPSPGKNGRLHFWNTHAFRMITSIAASIILVILVGKLTDTRLAVSGNAFTLTFGDAPVQEVPQDVQPVASLSPEQVQAMINTSLEKNNSVVQTSLEDTQKSLEASIRQNLTQNSGRINQLVRDASVASQDQIRQYVETMRTENMEQVKDYFQLTATEQKNYIENLLVDFAKYLQQQRNDDLRLVQTRMNSLEQNTDLFKQETEQILSNIMTSVVTPVTDETKY